MNQNLERQIHEHEIIMNDKEKKAREVQCKFDEEIKQIQIESEIQKEDYENQKKKLLEDFNKKIKIIELKNEEIEKKYLQNLDAIIEKYNEKRQKNNEEIQKMLTESSCAYDDLIAKKHEIEKQMKERELSTKMEIENIKEKNRILINQIKEQAKKHIQQIDNDGKIKLEEMRIKHEQELEENNRRINVLINQFELGLN